MKKQKPKQLHKRAHQGRSLSSVKKPTRSIIKRGESSSSNPTSTRHRDAARLSRFLGQLPLIAVEDRSLKDDEMILKQLPMHSINLIDALKPRKGRERTISGVNSVISDDDRMSVLSRNASLFARTDLTQFTNCSNPTFDPVHREWRSGSKLQSGVVKVLAAAADMIQQNGGAETDVEYFAIFLSFIEAIGVDQLEKIAAISYLLRLNIGKVSQGMLIRTFGQFSKIVLGKIEEIIGSDRRDDEYASSALKFFVSTLGTVLKAQPFSIWDLKNKSLLVSIFLRFSGEGAPQIRAAARRALVGILTDPIRCSQSRNACHPAAKFVGNAIHNAFSQQNFVGQRAPKDRSKRTLISRLLSLLEGLLYKMPSSTFLTLTEDIIKMASTSMDTLIRCFAFKCLYKTLLLHPSEEHSLSPSLTLQMIELLHGVQPRAADKAVISFWMKALIETHVFFESLLLDDINLRSKSDQLLSITIKILCTSFSSGSYDSATFDELVAVVSRLIEGVCKDEENSKKWAPFFLQQLDTALNPQNTGTWPFILRSMEALFAVAKRDIIGQAFEKVLKAYADIRDKETGVHDFDQLFGFAVRHVGPDAVLAAVSLELDVDAPTMPQDYRRSWILPVINSNLHNAPLALFVHSLLPLSVKLHQRLPQIPLLAIRKLYSVFEQQLWTYLPKCLASKPPDFDNEFPSLAPILGAAMNERPDLLLIILFSLRAGLQLAKEDDSLLEVRQVFERFSKNFMPILFGIYTDASGSTRPENSQMSSVNDRTICAVALEVIRLYAERVPSNLISKYVEAAILKLRDEKISLEKKLRIMDIVIAFAGVTNSSTSLIVFTEIQPFFTNEDAIFQKKAYRFLSDISKRIASPEMQNFFAEFLLFIEDELPSLPIGKVSCQCRHLRLSIWRNIINSTTSYHQLCLFVRRIFSEVISSLGPGSAKTRTQAGRCIQDICEALIKIGENEEVTPSSALSLVLTNFYASATTSRSFRSSLIALNIVSQRYLRVMNASLVSELVAKTIWAISEAKDVSNRLVAIRLLRIICSKSQDFVFEQYKDILLTSVFSQPIRENSSQDGDVIVPPSKSSGQLGIKSSVKLRKANSLLLGVLIERVGVEPLLKAVGEIAIRKVAVIAWQKQIKNLNKILRRRAKKRSQHTNVDVEDGIGKFETEVNGKCKRMGADSCGRSHISSATTAKTAGADSIFALLEGDEEESSDDEDFIKSVKDSHQQAVVLAEGSDDEPLDLLDRAQTMRRMTTVKAARKQAQKKSKKGLELDEDGPFKTNAEGRLLIVDLDAEDRRAKKKAGKKVRFAGEQEEGNSDDDDRDNDDSSEEDDSDKDGTDSGDEMDDGQAESEEDDDEGMDED